MNKVNVNIFGKEYTVVGDQDPERIARIAAHVDGKMNEIHGAAADLPLSSVAVLSCMEVTDECFTQMDRIEELTRQAEQHEADAQHYIQLWEEAKNSSVEYKQDSQQEIADLKQTNETLREQVVAKERELEELRRAKEAELAEAARDTEKKLEEARRMQAQVEETAKEESGREVAEAKRAYSDLENNYFDLQMENIRLKSELDKLRGASQQQLDRQVETFRWEDDEPQDF